MIFTTSQSLSHYWKAGISHLYESAPGKVVFPRRDELLGGLSNSKIVICFPHISHKSGAQSD